MHVDFIAAVFELLGLYLIGNRSWHGFASNIIGGILWILAVIISHQMFGLLLVVIPAIIINIINIKKWRKDEKKNHDDNWYFGDY